MSMGRNFNGRSLKLLIFGGQNQQDAKGQKQGYGQDELLKKIA
jgi:hypothetical protein